MRFVIAKVLPLEAANSGGYPKTYLMRVAEGLIDELLEKQSTSNVTEGEYRLNFELNIQRSSMNPDRK